MIIPKSVSIHKVNFPMVMCHDIWYPLKLSIVHSLHLRPLTYAQFESDSYQLSFAGNSSPSEGLCIHYFHWKNHIHAFKSKVMDKIVEIDGLNGALKPQLMLPWGSFSMLVSSGQ